MDNSTRSLKDHQ